MRREIEVLPEGAHAEIWYPGLPGAPQTYLTVGLMHVRAADDIRVSYDLQRDGWVIEQAQVFEWAADDSVCDPEWKEVAFVEAWASQRVPVPEGGT